MKWNLSNIYPTDQDFTKELAQAKALLTPVEDLAQGICNLQEARKCLRQLDSYVSCQIAQNPADPEAQEKNSQVSGILALCEEAQNAYGTILSKLDDESYQGILRDSRVPEIAFMIDEMRAWAQAKASEKTESIITKLEEDGYHSYWNLYQTVTNKMKVGEEKLSVGQAQNRLSEFDREKRHKAVNEWQTSWKENEDILAQILNHMAGFRLKSYEIRSWEGILFEPLFLNRMEEKSLDAMWEAVEAAKSHFIKYLDHKAKILGVEKLSWWDIGAPLADTSSVPYEEAKQQIVEQFRGFHPRMADFAESTFSQNWIEAEDRPGKAAGGFCVMLPKTFESRIFMTYTGTPFNIATLAHELGHAYHNFCLKDLPYFAQDARMNVAETASTFAETLVINRAIDQAKTREEKRTLLDDKLQRVIAYFMDLRCRFLFEKAFYAKRAKGYVSAQALCELMLSAQKEAFGDSLSDYEPHFWAAKLHFFYTQFPVYNFPYTFGYLLSTALLTRASQEPFGDKFDAFLRDTGSMSAENLVKKHLDADITKPAFWTESIDLLARDVDTFLSL